MVTPENSTLADIRKKVRRLVASPSTDELSDADLDEYINTAYSQDMPADIKSNLFRSVVEIFTVPNVDRYALSGTLAANTGPDTYESIREPVYVEGRRADFFKDRGQFYSVWPKSSSINYDLSGVVANGDVTGVDTTADPVNVITTTSTTGLVDGSSVIFSDIAGSTQLNGNIYVVSNVTATTFTVNQAGVGVFTGAGTWETRQVLNLGVKILQNNLLISGKFGTTFVNYKDDGDLAGTGTGNVVNTSTLASIGTVVYSTGLITLDFPSSLADGELVSTSYYTYNGGMPIAVLWWKDELIVRPVPDSGYKIQLEAYKYPTQFTAEEGTPILKQWFQYIALLAAVKILGDRQDMEGIANLEPLANRQERLIRNRISNEQIGQRNATIYEGNSCGRSFPYSFGGF